MLAIPAAPAVRKLAAEIARIEGELEAAEAALQAAREAAAVPRPIAQKIGPGELETARLSDLAGLTSGRVAELEATKEAEAQDVAEWKRANAAAVADVARHEAAVQFHTEALKEARRLEMAAMSAAASHIVAEAQQIYRDAVDSLKGAAADLAALNAISGASWLQRMRVGTPSEAISPIEVRATTVTVPALGAMDIYGRPMTEGAVSKDTAHVTREDLERAARLRADQIMTMMRGAPQ